MCSSSCWLLQLSRVRRTANTKSHTSSFTCRFGDSVRIYLCVYCPFSPLVQFIQANPQPVSAATINSATKRTLLKYELLCLFGLSSQLRSSISYQTVDIFISAAVLTWKLICFGASLRWPVEELQSKPSSWLHKISKGHVASRALHGSTQLV